MIFELAIVDIHIIKQFRWIDEQVVGIESFGLTIQTSHSTASQYSSLS